MRFLTEATDALLLYATTLVQRVDTSPWYAKVAAVIGALVSIAVKDLLFGAILLAGAASLIDWYYGRALAYKEKRYSPDVAHVGWQVKGGTLLVVLLIRWAEAWISAAPAPLGLNTMGAVSTFLAVGLFIDELDSIDENLRALGSRGIPGLSRVLAWLRAVSGRWVATSGQPLPEPREDGR